MTVVRDKTAAKVFVTGANGFIGRHLCVHLAQLGCEVTALSRAAWRPHAGETPPGEVLSRVRPAILPQISPATDFRPWLSGHDAVVHLAGRAHVVEETAKNPREEFHRVNVELTERIAGDALTCGIGRFVYLSSVGVLGNRSAGDPFHRSTPEGPVEDYAASKLEAERRLRARFAETNALVIVRPPLVYGRGAKGNFHRLMRLVQRLPVIPFGNVTARRSYVHVGNLCSFASRCLDPAVPAGAYLVCDDEPVLLPDVLRLMAAEMSKRRWLLKLPPAVLRMAGTLAGRKEDIDRLLSELIVDGEEDKRRTGWQPEFPPEDGIRDMVRHFARAA
ncbi:MAG: NAD-dependent epimerase/dehydratase family protein [Planctomycetaceae bacterium]